MNRYDSYKDSGVEWIGRIPSHWKLMSNKYFTQSQKNKSETGEEELLSVSEYHGVIPRRNIREGEEHLTRSESLEGYLKVKKGELVSNIMLMWKRGLGVSEFEGIVSPSYSVFSFQNSYPKYFHYLFRTDQYVSEFRRNSTGVIESRLRLYDDKFGSLKSHFPPLSEQQKIVTFLDTKTSLIDSLIEKTQRKIELLKEKRTSLVNEVVTKGLNPNVEMKDSGVEWIGEIPNHWDRLPLKNFGQVTLGKMLTSEDKGGYHLKPYLRSQNIQTERVNTSDIKEMWFSETELEKLRLEKGDLLFNEGGDVGRTCIWLNEIDECYIQNSVNRVRFGNDDERYYLHLSILYHSVGYYDSLVNRVSIPHLTKEKLESVIFLRPPLEEQQQIVGYLDEQTQKIDKTISIEEKRIELLKEYRQSLISEVVTGKRKVI